MNRRVRSNIQRKRRLPHRRTRRHENEIRRLKPRGQPVEINEAGSEAGERPLIRGMLFDLIEGGDQDLFHRHEISVVPPRCDAQYSLFRPIHDLLNWFRILISGSGDFRGGVDEVTELRLLPHDLGVKDDVRRRGNGVSERGNKSDAPRLFQLTSFFQPLGDRDHVDSFIRLVKRHNRLKNDAVRRPVKIITHQNFGGGADRVFFDKHSAQDRLFRFVILRRDAL